MPTRNIMRPQPDANLIVPNLDRVIPVPTTPSRWIRDFINVVNQKIDVINLFAYLGKERRNFFIIAVVTLNRATFATRFGDLSRCRVDGQFAITGGTPRDIDGTSKFSQCERYPFTNPAT